MMMETLNSVQICIYTIRSFNLPCKFLPKIWTHVAPLRQQEYGKAIKNTDTATTINTRSSKYCLCPE